MFIEYVPVDPATRGLTFSAVECERLVARQEELRKAYPSVLFPSSLGDEVKVGGCLAAGDFFTLARMATPNHAPFPCTLILV